MADMIRELRAYDPKPGLRFAPSDMQTVVPDIFVARTRQGLGDRAQQQRRCRG